MGDGVVDDAAHPPQLPWQRGVLAGGHGTLEAALFRFRLPTMDLVDTGQGPVSEGSIRLWSLWTVLLLELGRLFLLE